MIGLSHGVCTRMPYVLSKLGVLCSVLCALCSVTSALYYLLSALPGLVRACNFFTVACKVKPKKRHHSMLYCSTRTQCLHGTHWPVYSCLMSASILYVSYSSLARSFFFFSLSLSFFLPPLPPRPLSSHSSPTGTHHMQRLSRQGEALPSANRRW